VYFFWDEKSILSLFLANRKEYIPHVHKNRRREAKKPWIGDGSMRGRSESLTRVAHGATDGVLAPGEEELHQPRRDEAAGAGHAHALPRRLHCFFRLLIALVVTLPLKK